MTTTYTNHISRIEECMIEQGWTPATSQTCQTCSHKIRYPMTQHVFKVTKADGSTYPVHPECLTKTRHDGEISLHTNSNASDKTNYMAARRHVVDQIIETSERHQRKETNIYYAKVGAVGAALGALASAAIALL